MIALAVVCGVLSVALVAVVVVTVRFVAVIEGRQSDVHDHAATFLADAYRQVTEFVTSSACRQDEMAARLVQTFASAVADINAKAAEERERLLNAALTRTGAEYAQVTERVERARRDTVRVDLDRDGYEDEYKRTLRAMGYDPDEVPPVPAGL